MLVSLAVLPGLYGIGSTGTLFLKPSSGFLMSSKPHFLPRSALIWTKLWYPLASAVPLLSHIWSLLCTMNSCYTRVNSYCTITKVSTSADISHTVPKAQLFLTKWVSISNVKSMSGSLIPQATKITKAEFLLSYHLQCPGSHLKKGKTYPVGGSITAWA